jgi:hypothetical protein
MTNNPTDRMKDPFYAGLLFQIEHIICQADDDATSKAIPLTDSQIRSALIKTQKTLQDQNPDIPVATDKDKLLAALIDSLCRAPQALTERITQDDGTVEDKPLKVSDWIAALETVEDSVKTRKSSIRLF